MVPLQRGRYRARLAESGEDIARSLALRARSFRHQPVAAPGLTEKINDGDRFDPFCQHVLIEEVTSGDLVACFRLMLLAERDSLDLCYAGQSYDLQALQGFPGTKLELGRFCLAPTWHDPDILRLAWGGITSIVDAQGVRLMFGCSSFVGADPAPHRDALALLRRHLVAPDWAIGQKSAEIYPFAAALYDHPIDPQKALAAMPPLLRSYLTMGGWVSDHAVIDRDLDTLHVFTAVEIDRIPPARAKALRWVASGGDTLAGN